MIFWQGGKKMCVQKFSNVKINGNKCKRFVNKVVYLGHETSEKAIFPN